MRLTFATAALASCFALVGPLSAYAFGAGSAAVHEQTHRAHHRWARTPSTENPGYTAGVFVCGALITLHT